MNAPILTTQNLGLDIGGATIVADVSLEVAEGELLGIIGVTLPATRQAGLPANIITYGAELSNNSAGGVINSGPLKGLAFDANGAPYQLQLGPARLL